jgi:hypothetical protein
MLRIILVGRILYVENNRYLLTPISKEYRAVDDLPRKEISELAARLFVGLIAGPFHTALQPIFLLGGLLSGFTFNSGRDVREYRKTAERSTSYNYGAETALPRSAMCDSNTHFTQKIDIDCRSQCINKIVIEELAQYLDHLGIDVTDLRNKEMTIFNSGIFVQGGDVSAQTIAVGDTASAQTNLASPAKPSRTSAASMEARK